MESITAYALFLVESGEERNVKDEIKKLSISEYLKDVRVVYGEYDILAKLEIPSLKELNYMMMEKIRKIPGIIRTVTLLAD